MGYLDNAGLRHFWERIKAALSGKQDCLTSGDGVTIQEDTVSVATPVRAILTQAEYDTLPEEQKKKGLWVISD